MNKEILVRLGLTSAIVLGILGVTSLLQAVSAAEQTVTVDGGGDAGGYPLQAVACGGSTEYLYQDYDLSAVGTACLTACKSEWRWAYPYPLEGTGAIRCRYVGWDAVAGQPDPTNVISEWSSEVDVTTLTDSTQELTFTLPNEVDGSSQIVVQQYEWVNADFCNTVDTFIEVIRDNGPDPDRQFWRERVTSGIDNTTQPGRTLNDGKLIYDDTGALCTGASKFVNFTGDPLWEDSPGSGTYDDVLTQSDGTVQASVTSIEWSWIPLCAGTSTTPVVEDQGSAASTTAAGKLVNITVSTAQNTGACGTLTLWKDGVIEAAYEMTVQQ